MRARVAGTVALMTMLAACGGGGHHVTAALTNSPSAVPPPTQAPTAGHTTAAPVRKTSSPTPSMRPVATTAPTTSAPIMKTTPPPTRTTTAPPPVRTTTAPPPPPSGKTWTVDATDFQFAPASLTIAVGDSVKVADTQGTHTFTGSSWNYALSQGDTSPAVKFSKSGTYNYVCSYHQNLGMTGSITVK